MKPKLGREGNTPGRLRPQLWNPCMGVTCTSSQAFSEPRRRSPCKSKMPPLARTALALLQSPPPGQWCRPGMAVEQLQLNLQRFAHAFAEAAHEELRQGHKEVHLRQPAPNHEALVLPRYRNLFGAMRNPGSKRSNLNQRFVTRRIVSGNGSKLFQKPGPL